LAFASEAGHASIRKIPDARSLSDFSTADFHHLDFVAEWAARCCNPEGTNFLTEIASRFPLR